MSAKPRLHLVDPATGELADDAPDYREALALLGQLQTQIEMMDRDLRGKRLRIAELERDREQAALDDPLRPQVEALHALWRRGTGRRRPLHFADRERIGAALKRLGFATCAAAVAGAIYDPSYSAPRRNGKRERFDDLELVFREFARTKAFAARVPDDWQPDPRRIAEIVSVDPARVCEWLGRPYDREAA